jgi:Asp-tRNA(Asn)/Glu-tRNA(Gln) amidotransferase A subunit family amidase
VYTNRRLIEHQVAQLFESVDVLVTPNTGVTAFAAEGPLPDQIGGQSVDPFVCIAQPILASLCNLPALSVPAGLTEMGLPVGIQIMARRHREDICLRLGQLLEAELGVLRPSCDAGLFTT